MTFPRYCTAFLFCFLLGSASAQLLSWSPAFPADTTTSFSIIMDATKGNRGLLNYAATSDVYVHTGVITNLSTTNSDWKYVKFSQNFSQPNPQLQAVFLGNNKWRFTLTGNIRNYYGVPANETILKIAILFRSGNGSLAQRNADGSDMYIPVYGSALAGRITAPFRQPTFNPVPESLQLQPGDSFPFSGAANRNAALTLYYNGSIVASASAAASILVQPAPVITAGGNQTLVLRAQSGAEIINDTFRFYVPGPGTIAPLPAGVQDGINYENGDTSATLVLYAPDKQRVCIIGDLPGSMWEERQQYQMNKTPDGKYWWLRVSGLTPGNEYSFQYLIDGNLRVADPYSEKILDPWNDRFISPVTYPGIKPYPSDFTQNIVGILQTASPRYNWTTTGYQRPDKRKLIIYELLLRDFIASHDWNTLTDTLEYLKKTGINAIQLMPFNEFEGNISWGYNPSFYFAPDKYYGRANDLKKFIDICHASGMAVIMDIALNHSFGLSPMVRMYWDEANNRPADNNPWFNKAAKHGFNVGYDFNHESDATKYFTERVLRHWLTQYRIDGFRFDLSKGFTQRQTCDSTGNNCNISAWGTYDQSRINILNRYYDSMQSFLPGSYAILEHFADNSEETVLSNRGFLLWGNMNYNYSQASMGLANGADISYGLHTARGWNDPHLVTYMESHDEERVNYRNITAGNVSGAYNIRDSLTACKRMELSHVFLLTLPGPKMIWQFGELGYDYPINYCENGTVNNNCRTDPKPIRWNYLLDQKRNSIYDLVGHINRLRNHDDFSDLFVTGNVSSGLTGLQKWIKLWDPSGPGMLAVGNFDLVARDLSASFPSAGVWYDYLNPPDSIIASGGNRTFSLQPGEYKIFINRFIPLPGTIISFTGTNSGFINLLRWNVLEEQEVAGYELQRSIDSLNFTRVALLNRNNSGNYSYDDDIAILSSGIFFYRVKLIFNDGSFKYSKVIRLTLPAPPPADEFSVKLSPNPFSGSPVLDISSPAAGQAALMIFDMAGRLMAKGNYSVARGDNRLFIREATGFAGGAYLIKVVQGDTIKLIKAFKSN